MAWGAGRGMGVKLVNAATELLCHLTVILGLSSKGSLFVEK